MAVEKCLMDSRLTKNRAQGLPTVLTIGHSTRTFDEFLRLLKAHGVTCIVDVRTVPRSRHNPQFNRDILPASLKMAGIGYTHMAALGGLRHTTKDSINTGWRNASFRGYADYMQTPEFRKAVDELIQMADQDQIALMCAEAVPWRCHRSMIADALVVRGIQTADIMGLNPPKLHTLTSFAKVKGTHITYPPDHAASNKLKVKKASSEKTAARRSAGRRHSSVSSVALAFKSKLRSAKITAHAAKAIVVKLNRNRDRSGL
jgi:hypothetical protein